MPPKSKVQPKNKYSEIIKKSNEDLEFDEMPLPEKEELEPVPENKEDELEDEQKDETPSKKKTVRKYVKKPKELYADAAGTAQYNAVLKRVGDLAELFSQMQNEQNRINQLVEKTVKANNEAQVNKLDDALKQSREFFLRMAK